MKTLAILGAGGRTGTPLVKQALEKGYRVNALVRNPEKLAITHDNLSIIQGDALDGESVEKTVNGSDAVLMVLGHGKSTPDDLLKRSTEFVLSAMKKHNVERLINLTGAGVRVAGDSPKLIDHVMKGLLTIMAGKLLRDSEAQHQLVSTSGMEWTVVRVPILTDNEPTGKIKAGMVGQDMKPKISRTDVALFMLEQVESKEYVQKSPMICNVS